jgi:hypothetical protein
MNIEHPTSNIQHPVSRPTRARNGCSLLAVGCWMFLVFPALTGFAQTSTNALPVLVPAYPELPPTFWQQHQTTIIVAGFALLAFVFLLLITLLRPKSPETLSPETVARQALARLQDKPEDGLVLSVVSQILRRYLGDRFDLSNGEMTTAEFCTTIKDNEKLGAELAATVSSFLQECDVRKFSPLNAATPLNAVSRAAKLVELAEARCMEIKAQPGGPRD